MSEVAPLSPRQPKPDAELKPWFYALVRWFFSRTIRLILKMRVNGAAHVPRTGPVLLAGNHRGFLDGPLVAFYTPRPASFLAKSELFRGRLGTGLAWVGQIPVDRGRVDRVAMRRAVDVLESGGALGMFPEGTRGAGSMDNVQHGVGYLALRVPGVPIVPTACIGTEEAMPKGARFPRLRSTVDIVFGPPFYLEPVDNPRSRRAVAEATEQIRVRLAAHVAAVEREHARTS